MTPLQKQRLISWIVSTVIALLLASGILLLKQDFSTRGFADAFFISGAFLLAVIGLRFVTRQGTFDIFGYSMTRLVDSFKKDNVKSYPDAYTYMEFKKEERIKSKPYIYPQLTLSLLFILIAVVLRFF